MQIPIAYYTSFNLKRKRDRLLLRKPRGQGEAVGKSRNEGHEVEQRRNAMSLSEPLVERQHLLRVRSRVVALLAIFLLCSSKSADHSKVCQAENNATVPCA